MDCFWWRDGIGGVVAVGESDDPDGDAVGHSGVVFLSVLLLCVLCDRTLRGPELPIFRSCVICSVRASEPTSRWRGESGNDTSRYLNDRHRALHL